jgi:MFS family permease
MGKRAGGKWAERPAPEERKAEEREEERPLPRALPQPAAAALVFVAAGAVLMLEILAVRLLAPYVGLTLETTTSIIGAALAGIALGAAVGGYFADRVDTRLLIVGLLVGGGALALLTVPAVHWLGPSARGEGTAAALAITAIALVPAAAVLSAVSPAVAHLQLHDLHVSGTIVGRLSAWATAGALVGTFGTGFVIVPAMPVGTAVLLIGMVLMVVGVVLGVTASLLSPARAAAVVLVALGLGALTATADSPCLTESDYHCLSLEPDPANADGFELVLDDAHNSYTDLKDPTHLKYRYVRWIAGVINSENPGGKPLDVVFVGGGAFTLPRWLLATRPGSNADVLEVDPDIVTLDEERLGLRTSPHLRARIGDARVSMLDIPDDSADVVVGDAFSGYTVPWHLTTAEWLDEVERVLKPDGIYAMNLIDLQPLDFLKAETATFLDTFQDVQLVAIEEGSANTVLVGSDRRMPRLVSPAAARAEGRFAYPRSELVPFAADAEALRDDFAPVDQLRTAG